MTIRWSLLVLNAAAVAALSLGPAQSVALAQTSALATRSESAVGLSASRYEYTERGIMSLNAMKIGVDLDSTFAFRGDWPDDKQVWFAGVHVRYAAGAADYSSPSSGSQSNTPDWYYSVKGVFGGDIPQGNYVLAPFVGLGYRYHFNDLRGLTTTGAAGYRRESIYTTVSLGVTHRMALADQSLLVTTLEFSHLLEGTQKVKRSDLSSLLRDVTLKQRQGYGLRLNMMRRFAHWSIGPTIDYWSIADSDSGGSPAIYEPKNHTMEIGIKAMRYF